MPVWSGLTRKSHNLTSFTQWEYPSYLSQNITSKCFTSLPSFQKQSICIDQLHQLQVRSLGALACVHVCIHLPLVSSTHTHTHSVLLYFLFGAALYRGGGAAQAHLPSTDASILPLVCRFKIMEPCAPGVPVRSAVGWKESRERPRRE